MKRKRDLSSDSEYKGREKEEESNGVEGPLAILWDIDNCCIPSGLSSEIVVDNTRKYLRKHGIKAPITLFSAYGDFSNHSSSQRGDCQWSGINLIHVSNRKKDAADKTILVDMLLFAMDNPPPSSILLISGDVDFSPALHKLEQRGHSILVATINLTQTSYALLSAAKFVWEWPQMASNGNFQITSQRFEPQSLPNGLAMMASGGGHEAARVLRYGGDPVEWGSREVRVEGPRLEEGPSMADGHPFDPRVSGPGQNGPKNDSWMSGPFPSIGCHTEGQSGGRSFEQVVLDQGKKREFNHIIDLHPQQGNYYSETIRESNPDLSMQVGKRPNNCGLFAETTSKPSPASLKQHRKLEQSGIDVVKEEIRSLIHRKGGCITLRKIPILYQDTFNKSLTVKKYGFKLKTLLEKMGDDIHVYGQGNAACVYLISQENCLCPLSNLNSNAPNEKNVAEAGDGLPSETEIESNRTHMMQPSKIGTCGWGLPSQIITKPQSTSSEQPTTNRTNDIRVVKRELWTLLSWNKKGIPLGEIAHQYKQIFNKEFCAKYYGCKLRTLLHGIAYIQQVDGEGTRAFFRPQGSQKLN